MNLCIYFLASLSFDFDLFEFEKWKREVDVRQRKKQQPGEKLTSNSASFTSQARRTSDPELVPIYKPQWLSLSPFLKHTHTNPALTELQMVFPILKPVKSCSWCVSSLPLFFLFPPHSLHHLFLWVSFDKSENITMRGWSLDKFCSSLH